MYIGQHAVPSGDESDLVGDGFAKLSYHEQSIGDIYSFDPSTREVTRITDDAALYKEVEAKLDGSREKTILSDGWVNWLPVYDPSGQYVCYLKNSSGTAAHIRTCDGRDLGRFIPNITRLRYFDWK